MYFMKAKPWIPWICFVVVYILNFWVASRLPGFPVEEALGSVIILGVFFFGIAYVLSRRETPVQEPKALQQNEPYILSGTFVLVSVALIFGNDIIGFLVPDSVSNSLAAKEVVTLVRKVLVFVIVPFLVYKYLFGFSLRDFGLITVAKKIFSGRNVFIFICMALLFTLLQWFGGRAAEPIRSGEFSGVELMVGMPLAFIWLFIEVGLVEEFFFRALLQDRISVLTNSTSWGIVLASLLFGLAHAPGMYFREAGTIEGLGENPSVIATISYCIAVQATAGLPFAMIWSKTRNLWLLMAIHAAADLLSNYPSLMSAFNNF